MILVAALAGTLLLAANLATWVHLHVMDTDRAADAVAAATVDDVRTEIRERTAAAVDEQVSRLFTDRGLTPPFSVGDDVGRAVDEALGSELFLTAWRAAVAVGLERGVTGTTDDGAGTGTGTGTGGDDADAGADRDVDVRLGAETVAEVVAEALLGRGYGQLAGVRLSTPGFEVQTSAEQPRANELLRAADRWWWALGLGALVLGAVALAVTRDRRRLGVVLGLDVMVVAAVSLLLVPVGRLVAGDLADDPTLSGLVESAYDALTRSLLVQSAWLLAAGALVAVVCAAAPAVRDLLDPRVG